MIEHVLGHFCAPQHRVTRVIDKEVPRAEEVPGIEVADEEVPIAEEVSVMVTDVEVALIPPIDADDTLIDTNNMTCASTKAFIHTGGGAPVRTQ